MKQYALQQQVHHSMINLPQTLLILLAMIQSTRSIVCSGATPKLYAGACYATCASASQSYEYQNTCYGSCPATAPYDYFNVCYPNCPWIPPNQTYLQISSCVSNCSTGFADDYSRKCVPNCPSTPILTFKDINRKRCVQMCSTNPSQFANLNTKTCVADCPSTTWGEPDTRKCLTTCPVGTYYQLYGSARLCVSKCYPNYYAGLDRVCVNALGGCPTSPIMYYGDDISNLCVEECPYNSSTYAQDSTQKCVYFCTLGTFADDISRRCLTECPMGPPRYYGSNITHQCHLQCNEGEFADDFLSQCVQICTNNTFGDYSTRKCVPVCPSSQKTFADPLTSLCVTLCSPGYFADNDTRSCVTSTSCSRNYVGDPLTLRCIPIKSCPSGYFADVVNKICVTRCPVPFWGQLTTRQCQLFCEWLPPGYLSWYDPSTRICIKKCPSNPRTFALNTSHTCVPTCPAGFFGSVLTYQCVKTCPDGYHAQNVNRVCVSDCNTNSSVILYKYTPNTTCIDYCPEDYYADNQTMSCVRTCPEETYAFDGNNTCLPGCPEDLYADNHSQSCVEACPALTLEYADDSTNMCVKTCPVVPDYFGEDLNDGKRKCVSMCSLSSKYADPISRTCVSKCNLNEGYYAYQPDRRCYLTCPTGYGNPLTAKCTSRCPESPKQLFGDNSTVTCVSICPNETYGDRTRELCVFATDCPPSTFADDDTQRCVPKCSSLLNLFGDPTTRKCVKYCPFGYFADNTTRKCETNCNSTSFYYKDPSTKRCVDICPTMPDLYAETSSMSCVDKCSGGYYRLNYTNSVTTTRKCVAMCPSSPVFYADEQTKTCVRQCANQTYLFFNNSYRGCLKVCPPQVYTGTYSVDLFADNTTWKCVATCPQKYFALKHPTNTSVRVCVKMCEVIAGVYYFAETMTRKCVTACPLRLYGTFGDRISLACVANCSREQFRDNLTKQCQYECSDGYFADNTTWNCVKKCPNGTYAESINKTCVKYCPTDYYAYTRTNQCVQYCAHWRYYADNTTWKCVTECPTDPDYYADYASRTCVIRCPDGTFASNDTVTTSVTRMCVLSRNCMGTKVADPVNNRCRARCTTDPMYYAMPTTKLCGPNCFNRLFADNTTGLCVAVCPAPYFGVNSSTYFKCVQFCPEAEYKLTPGRMCVAECPPGLFADNLTMSCVSVCPDQYYGRVSDNTCVMDCYPQYRDDLSKQCKSRCPSPYTASNSSYQCQWKCDYGQYEHDRICYSACADFNLFADNLTRKCLPSCPDDPWTYADTSNYQCVFVCATGLFGFEPNRTCLAHCPPGYFMEHNTSLCLSVCLEGQYADLNSSSCVTDCLSTNYTFINPFTRSCVEKCPEDPDLYGYQNQTCVAHCPVGWYAENVTRTCMQVCPNDSAVFNQSWADELTHRCVERCSALSYAYSNSTDNICVNFCPDGWFASQIQQSCVEVCPNATFAHNDSHTCVEFCPNGEFGDMHTKICSSECHFNDTQYRDNSTNMCVERCPDNPSMFAQDSTNECVLTCQAGYYGYIVNRTCVQNCPDPYFIDRFSQMCVLACPIHTDTFADDQINTCTPTCTNYTINSTVVMFYADRSTLQCVAMCPETPQKLYGLNESNLCVDSCPAGTFGDNDTRLCLDRCVFEDPKFTWRDYVNNFCVTFCPLNYFADNRTFSCSPTCTTGFFADNSTRRCVVSCPVEPASYGYIPDKKCVYFCPDGLFADEISRNCIPVCPTTPFVYYHYKPTNKCVRQCIYPYFAEVASLYCVKKCQDGFYGNLTTHKCETCKVECVTCSAYLECLSCLTGFFLYKYECVTECPSYPVMYFAHLESGICFLSCPPPYFGQTNTGLCHLSCPVLYYGDLATRVCKHCPEGCLTCDAFGCFDCLADYVYVVTSLSCSKECNSTHVYYFRSQCYELCPDGSYLSVLDLVTCLPCSTQCAACSLSAANCTKCAYKFFYNYQCVDACPSNHFVDSSLSCVACSLYPDKCVLPPLSYKISPFTQNYQLHAYVVFNRVVNLTLEQFQQTVQVKYNGQTVRPSSFSVKFYNKTTYWITFKNSSSLNENSLSIGFQPGFIVDMFGNQLTVNLVEAGFQAQTGVTEEIATSSNKISTTTSVFSWVLLALVLLFLIKSGYPFLVAIECVQLYYMFTFVRLSPMPYMQLQYLSALKNVHFLFLPSFFAGPNYTIKQYESFLTNTSFLYNCSPFLVIVGFCIAVYFLFFLLSSKKLISNKRVRQVSKRIRKYRLKYGILNDAIWFVYLYAIFMAMLQFGQASVTTTWDTVNIVLAALVFVVLVVYTFMMIYLGNKYKDPAKKLPTKWAFLRFEPAQFPMEIAMRYIRKFLFCCGLLFHEVEAQCIVIIVCCFLFLIYLLCYKPSQSNLTNGINVGVETSYIVLAGMYYGFNKLENKSLQEQIGFSIALIVIKSFTILILIGWIIYRGLLLIRSTQAWQNVYAKITQDKSPDFLREQQRKRDLQFDWGQFENQSQGEKTDHHIIDSYSRNMKNEKTNIFDIKDSDEQSELMKEKNEKSHQLKESNSSYEGSHSSEDNIRFKASRTQRIQKPKKKEHLEIKDVENSKDISQIDLRSVNSREKLKKPEIIKVEPAQENSRQGRAIWDDIEFDDHQI